MSVPTEIHQKFISEAIQQLGLENKLPLDYTADEKVRIYEITQMKSEDWINLNKESNSYDYIKPQHYKLWKDNNDVNHVLKASLTREEYLGFLKGSILKYQLRMGKKPNEPVERDQEKIKWYQDRITELENEK